MFGSAFTIALIHRRNRLAGIIGFSIIALLAVRVGSRCLDSWTSAFWLAKNPGIARSGFAYFRHVLPRIGQALARNRHDAYNYLPSSVGEFPSGEALAERMRAAGLARVKFWPLTLGVATLYVGEK